MDRLLQIDSALDRDVDSLGEAFSSAIRTDLQSWFRRVQAAILRLKVDPNGHLRKRQPTLSVRRLVRDLSGPDATTASHLRRSVRTALLRFGEGARATGIEVDERSAGRAATAINTLHRSRLSQFHHLYRGLSGAVDRAVTHAVGTGELPAELLVGVMDEVNRIAPTARTLFETAIMDTAQIAVAAHSTTSDVFLYSGPIDDRCRPFCMQRVGKVYSRANIDRMDNGQLANTFLTRGGYNCRHQWRPVRKPALIALADTGRHVDAATSQRVASVTRFQHLTPRPLRRRTA